uniref:Adenylate cyclase type 9 n=1 Tax=Phallusia mammillata TaxID=59560 RepID=A0A6F9D555_9ASCI|nr:adenylate cyclase type 9-like [Phallusia mammillata]
MAANNRVEYNTTVNPNVDIVYHENGMNKENGDHHDPNLPTPKGMQPKIFERSTGKWWNPKQDSEVLQKQYIISSFPQVREFYRHSLLFVCVSCIVWIIYYGASNQNFAFNSWLAGAIWGVVLVLVCLLLLVLTKQNIYPKYPLQFALVFLAFIVTTGLVVAYFTNSVATTAGSFFITAETIILIYLVSPLPVPVTFLIAVIFSIITEVLLHMGSYQQIIFSPLTLSYSIGARIVLHVALHVIGFHALFNLQVLRHSSFWKIFQLVQITQRKHKEAEFKEVMIKSVMPLSVAKTVMSKMDDQPIKEGEKAQFRPFMMERRENVSILYADIVGFTQMSANKTAAELVRLLNDLFARFDRLCEVTGCEKISTLGDCYYCVAGCPNENLDHAKCCVEMGLGMIRAIKEFCIQNNTNVNMRVGIHTGYVLCGVVGTKRFKFDVWSNDVSLANGMEQHGIPGRIHISQQTLDCLGDRYIVEDSHLEDRDKSFMEKTGRTFLIVRRNDGSQSNGADTNSSQINSSSGKLDAQGTNNVGTAPKSDTNNSKVQNTSHPSTEPLLYKHNTTNSHIEQPKALQDASNISTSQNSLSQMLKQDQLMEYLGQPFGPFSKPGPLSQIREKEDKKTIDEIKNDPMLVDFYENTGVNQWTLSFLNDSADSQKITLNYEGQCEKNVREDNPITMCISPRYRLFLDIMTSSCVTILTFVSSILLLGSVASNPAWIVVFVFFATFLVALSILSGLYIYHEKDLQGCFHSFALFLSTWEMRHVLGALILLIPACVLFSHISCQSPSTAPSCSNYVILGCVVILHFVNYDQLSTWMRTALSIVVTVVILALVYSNPCGAKGAATVFCGYYGNEGLQRYEFIADFLLLIIFVWFINRQYELGYRLVFFTEHQTATTAGITRDEHKYVEALLENFIPPHVRKSMKDQPLYSQTHKKVGVIFGTIVNFNELYEENYAGGIEFIRFLSELISDVDDLLDKEEYKDIEKIKTIGTTFMIASGLHPNTDQETNSRDSHLAKLMDFCVEMQNTVDDFNKSIVNFHLILRIGFNHGEVTAGVIGSTKKLYDIWGDTVNTASRMDSTGEPGRVQVSQESKKVLEEHFNFEYLADKFVKGKGIMSTYLLVRDDEDQRKLPDNRKADYEPFR